MIRIYKYFFLLTIIISGSCSKLELIDPPGIEINIEADSIVFAEIGDFGYSGDHELEVSQLVKSWEPDFIISAGDNNYTEGKLSTIKQNITQYYGDYIYNFDAPSDYRCKGKAYTDSINRFFPTPGNHDANNKDGLVPYFNYFTLPGNESYYQYTWGPVAFYSLNTVYGLNKQEIWLKEQIALCTSPFKIVFFHHSPFSVGEHGSDEETQLNFYSMGVDVVFTGHDHIYNRIEKEGEAGTYYIVNGLGGRERFGCNENSLSTSGYTSFCYDSEYGAVKVTATHDKMVIAFYSVIARDEPVDKIIITK